MLGLGGAHISHFSDDGEAVEFVRAAIEMGVTFMDNAWEYSGGRSEDLMGRALEDGYRERVFLMTKHHGRDKETAERHLDESLARLRTDVIDLWQFHEVIYESDPDMIFAPGGGIEVAERAKASGRIRYIGFTGHKDPAILRKMLDTGFPWDTVQLPVNVLDAHFRSFQREIIPELLEREIGVLAMKTLAGGHLLETGTVSVEEALSFVWSLPVSTIISGMDSLEALGQNVESARSWQRPAAGTLDSLLERTREVAADGRYEPFKTATDYDGRFGRRLHGLG
jgi:predicted aldo/keto reductase-like oxidoreductase